MPTSKLLIFKHLLLQKHLLGAALKNVGLF